MRKPRAGAEVYTAAEMAEKFNKSIDGWYDSVRTGTCPIEPLWVGRNMVWPKARVDELLGIKAGVER